MTRSVLIAADRAAPEAWERLGQAADDRAHPMRLATLATIGGDGAPSARLMILRGVDRERSALYFHTDRRSSTIAEIAANPAACVAPYDARDGVEVRLAGTAAVRVAGPLVERVWEQTSLALQYL